MLEQSIQDCLCKTCRASGLPQDMTHQIVNLIGKWVRCNGIEWTVDRLKELHHWYETSLAGIPNIPAYHKHSNGLPKGEFRKVFLMQNKQCALAILSMHTAFKHSTVSVKQEEKLRSGLQTAEVRKYPYLNYAISRKAKDIPRLVYQSPAYQVLTGVSIPVGRDTLRLGNGVEPSKVAEAYARSWENLPSQTARFIRNNSLGDHVPLIVRSHLDSYCSHEVPVGHLACIQEPSLKARWVANPNRITQHFLTPLKRVWQGWLREMPSDCTYCQSKGVRWVQEQLKLGIDLAAVDLKSASDKIGLWPSLDLVHHYFCEAPLGESWDFKSRSAWLTGNGYQYLNAIDHFASVSRGEWFCKCLGGVMLTWENGQPLGTGPSFPLLGLTNNLIAAHVATKLKLGIDDSFRVIGDDIVMRAEMFSGYQDRVTRIGGEINTDKTMMSNKAVEFAGRVITKDDVFAKRVKSLAPSDNSFMMVTSAMGDQAKGLLRPRQRKVYNELRFVPGAFVEGPYPQHNVTRERLDLRYLWYLENFIRHEIKPDDPNIGGLQRKEWINQFCVALKGSKNKLGKILGYKNPMEYIPIDLLEGVQPSQTAYQTPTSGDPRLENGLTMLEGAEKALRKGLIKPFPVWKSELLGITLNQGGLRTTGQPSHREVSRKPGRRHH